MEESRIWLYRDARKAIKQGWAAILERQRTRLADQVAFARANSPYYRERYRSLPARIEDSRLLPVTTKTELMAHFDDWCTDREVTIEKTRPFVERQDLFGKQLLGRYLVITTSGTTGTRGVFLTDERTLSVVGPMFLRMMRSLLGVRDLINMVAHGGRVAAVVAAGTPTATGVGIGLFSSRLGKAFRSLSVHTPLPELVTQLNEFQPLMLMSYGTVMKLLAGEQEAGRLHINPVLVLLTAEGLVPDEYDRIARMFGSKLGNSYAASECQFMSSMCERKWLHVNADWVVLEPVDADYNPVPAGVRSYTVLVSNLANRVQPILRYDLGDSVVERADPCECGNPLPAIRVEGRTADMLTLSTTAGSSVTLPSLAFVTLLERVDGLEQFQIVQTGPESLKVRQRTAAGASEADVWAATQAAIRELLRRHRLEQIAIDRTSELPERAAGGKVRPVLPLEQ